ncbi:GMC family oxidoreductase [Natronomonas sp. EA1]|uniref:GMC family oxidoreductase n=1 Tax=Natronomonas sp. EA1 TaxID=3421655 RepID=UPI003EBB087B
MRDAVIVGAGPAGALVANRLADAGHDVLVLEAGPRFDFDERPERQKRSIRPAHADPEVWDMGGDRDAFSTTGELYYPLNVARVKGVGGSTLHWQGMVMRLHESDFDGTHGRAWPLSYDDIEPYYGEAERALGVAGASDNPFEPPRSEPYPMPAFPPSYSDSIFADACERLGITTHSVGNARNSEGYDGRSPCVGYGTCKPVCPSGAKYSADFTIADAEAKGVDVVAEAPVQRLETDEDGGRVTRAVYAKDGAEHAVEAEQFVLAAGGIEIPRLLLLSANDAHPDGLANSSGAVGRYFTDHLFAGAGGRLDRRTRQNHIGFITTESHQFYDDPGIGSEGTDGDIPPADGAFQPVKLEFLNYAGPSPVEQAMAADDWGDSLLSELRDSYGTHIAMGALVGMPGKAENRVTLDTSRTDDHGNPVPDLRWSIPEQTKRTLARANEIQHAVLEELGASIDWTVGPDNTGPAYHHMGTTRMSSNPNSGVVDARMRTHDVSNLSIASSSVFPTGGAMNPTLTIAALALKCADHVAAALA